MDALMRMMQQTHHDPMNTSMFDAEVCLASGFCKVRVHEEDIHNTSFLTLDGLMEWVAMPFGLCNAPFTFQWMMNAIIRDFLQKFVIVFLDDVSVYSRMMDEHLEHVRFVLQRFKEERLKLRL
jgi:hypothetical protein